jgi:hypothetical protein
MNIDVVLKQFEQPDETLTFEKGRFEIVHVGGMTIGRATYEPGWRWSEHIGKTNGASCARWSTLGLLSQDDPDSRWKMGRCGR